MGPNGNGGVENSPSTVMTDFLRQCGGVALIDGGLATELERRGADLNDPLWSAKCLLTSPHLVRAVHLDYLEAGADIIMTASYQATIQGFEAKGFTREESEALLKKSVEIAHEARDIYYKKCRDHRSDFNRDDKILNDRTILVAASVGSYGAYLADGSEYRTSIEDGFKFLQKQAYADILEEEDIKVPAWFSFNSKDGIHVVSGDYLLECASIAESCSRVIAVGINCSPPRFIHSLILSIKKVSSKPILVYPNSGESYDADRKEWVENTGVSDKDFVSYVHHFWEAAAEQPHIPSKQYVGHFQVDALLGPADLPQQLL
ncbi:Homocysteine-binding domain, partial [Dillenia turbinata]